jgi:wyosine [tRNA(Phe)-imidazoG37] synthetase (radical SAM superfamily)
MSMSNMPSFTEIREFSAKLGERLGMNILKERKDSRVLVLGEDEKKLKIPGIGD